MIEFEIITLKSGLKSLRSLQYGETFHPVTGPKVEAQILHVQQQRLLERSSATENFILWDVGFGAGANALAAIEVLKDSKNYVEIYSFDRSTTPMEFALKHSEDLEYLSQYKLEIEQLIFKGEVWLTPRLKWKLRLKDFREEVTNLDLPSPHGIFYDPYSPIGNPEMWTLEHFRSIRSRLLDHRPCLFTNYTRSTAMRVALLLAGFYVGVGCGVGEKDETTIASNSLDLLEKPLGQSWLERVKKSGNAAPLRSSNYFQKPISIDDYETLKNAAQFLKC